MIHKFDSFIEKGYSTSADLTFLSKENHRCAKKDFRCMILQKGSNYFLVLHCFDEKNV